MTHPFGKNSRNPYVVLISATVLLLGTTIVSASELPSGAFIVSPVKEEMTLSPGESKTVMIKVMNGTQFPLTVTPSYEDIAPDLQRIPGDNPVKLLGSQKSSDTLIDLIDFPKKSFDLLSGKSVEVPVTVKLPKDIIPGGRYGSVIWSFKISGGGTNASANVALQSRIGALFFVRVAGESNEKGKLVSFGLFNNSKTANQPTKEEPLRFQVSFENQGNVHLNPYGRITISGMIISPKVVNIDPWVVLPGATRMREINFFDGLFPGYYNAHLELNRGYKDTVDEQDVSFWILPTVSQSVIGLIILILLTLLIRRSFALSRHSIK